MKTTSTPTEALVRKLYNPVGDEAKSLTLTPFQTSRPLHPQAPNPKPLKPQTLKPQTLKPQTLKPQTLKP